MLQLVYMIYEIPNASVEYFTYSGKVLVNFLKSYSNNIKVMYKTSKNSIDFESYILFVFILFTFNYPIVRDNLIILIFDKIY